MDREVSEIVSDLLGSYQEVGGINRIDCSNLPSKPAIGVVCEDLLRLAFPGFLDTEAIASGELENETAIRVSKVITALEKEVVRSLRFVAGEGSVPADRAHELVCSFLRQLPGIRRVLRTDVEAAYEGDPAAKSFDEIILAYPCLEAIAIQRMARIFYQEGVPLIPRMMTEWAHSKTGIDIHPGARIGSHFFIDHGTGVVIGETCEIGQGNPIKGVKRHPNVEDWVTIYPGATILGGETTIGARSTIGASAFIMRSIEPDSLVALPEVTHDIKDKSEHRRISEEKEGN